MSIAFDAAVMDKCRRFVGIFEETETIELNRPWRQSTMNWKLLAFYLFLNEELDLSRSPTFPKHTLREREVSVLRPAN